MRSACRWRPKRPRPAGRLGEAVRTYLGRNVAAIKKTAPVVEYWQQILPPEFYDHCSLISIHSGTLLVEVEPGPFMHQLQVISSELLEHLQNKYPSAGITKISLRPTGSTGDTQNRPVKSQ